MSPALGGKDMNPESAAASRMRSSTAADDAEDRARTTLREVAYLPYLEIRGGGMWV